MEKPHSEVARTEPLLEPQQSSEPTRQASGGSGASSALTDTRSPDGLPSGVSMLAAIDRAPGGSGAGGTGGGAGAATSSTPGASAGGITRTAIPKGGYQVQPRYPTSARRLGIQGTTLLRVFVAGDGRVTEIAVERTAGHADLDEAAAEAVRRWRFEPARRGDEPVSMWVLLPVEFRLR
jgi:protein TonB